MKYIEIHCHLDFPDYGEEIAGVLARMKEGEVGAITIGPDLESAKRAVKIAEENENIWACIGVIPSDNDTEIFDEKEFEKLVIHPKVVAIGECGLDFFRTKPESLVKEKERQERLFKQQIEFALKYDKPLMLHCRNTYDDVLDILESYKKVEGGEKLSGNAHFFAGTVEQAKRFLDLGFTCSFTGVITFANNYDEVVRSLPLESIMSETDSPFVAPVPHRGKRNEPTYVVEVVKKLAEIRKEDEEVLRQKMIENAKRVFGLPN